LAHVDPQTEGAHEGMPKRRQDKTPESYLAGVHLRASMIWIKDLIQTTS